MPQNVLKQTSPISAPSQQNQTESKPDCKKATILRLAVPTFSFEVITGGLSGVPSKISEGTIKVEEMPIGRKPGMLVFTTSIKSNGEARQRSTLTSLELREDGSVIDTQRRDGKFVQVVIGKIPAADAKEYLSGELSLGELTKKESFKSVLRAALENNDFVPKSLCGGNHFKISSV